MKKERMTKTLFVLCIVTFAGISLAAAKATEPVKVPEPIKAPVTEEMNEAKEALTHQENMESMNKCTMMGTKTCNENMKSVSEAMAALDEAVKALDSGNTAKAKAQVEKAKKMLTEVSEKMQKCMDKMPAVNESCPITGIKIDRMKVSEKDMTMYKGKKVGFCSQGCVTAWDKLTDAEKEAKLEKAMVKMPTKKEMRQMKEVPAKKLPSMEHPK